MPAAPPPPGVRMEGRFAIGDAAARPVALHLAAGRWTCLLGPSGVGKSTVLRLLAGLDAPGARFDGEIAAEDGAPLPGRIAYMAQADLLAPWADVAANVALGARLRGERPDRARIAATIAEVGLSAHSGKTPAELSGGMRQRAALARTLMEDRPVVLMDEPFSALDARTRAEMQDLAFRALAGRTVLLVTHDPGEAVRLGHAIRLMSAEGLAAAPPPERPPLRDRYAPASVAAEAALLDALRGGP